MQEIVGEFSAWRAGTYQAAVFAAFFFFGPCAAITASSALGFEGSFTAAQRLICACRIRSRASALIFLRFFVFRTFGIMTDAVSGGLPGLLLIAAVPAELKSVLACSRREIKASISERMDFNMVR